MLVRVSLLLGSLATACFAPRAPSAKSDPPHAPSASSARPSTPTPTTPPPSVSVEARIDPDGNDETAEPDLALPEAGRFEKVGRHWAALGRICDFAVVGDALFMAHATSPLGLDGATVTRYQPDAKPPFSLAFNWNREGEPTRGGGGGQGFLRLRLLEGRLYVPDADPPYLGLGQATGIEGYLFASDTRGVFAGARLPGHLPPRAKPDGTGGLILPGALHGFDAIRFRGKLYASTSAAIPPNGNAKTSPGTLFTPGDRPGVWQVAFSYDGAPGEQSVRLGYMTRFRDRLYVALSPLYGRDRHDFLVIAPPRDSPSFSSADARAVQITPLGGAHTLRWYADRGKLYWLTIGGQGVQLRVTEDGERFKVLSLPDGAGHPSDILRVGARLLVLAEHGLYELLDARFELRAPILESKTPFKVDDGYCAAPLAVYRGSVYAGDQRRGALWKLTAAP
jgi:hypothetical protein